MTDTQDQQGPSTPIPLDYASVAALLTQANIPFTSTPASQTNQPGLPIQVHLEDFTDPAHAALTDELNWWKKNGVVDVLVPTVESPEVPIDAAGLAAWLSSNGAPFTTTLADDGVTVASVQLATQSDLDQLLSDYPTLQVAIDSGALGVAVLGNDTSDSSNSSNLPNDGSQDQTAVGSAVDADDTGDTITPTAPFPTDDTSLQVWLGQHNVAFIVEPRPNDTTGLLDQITLPDQATFDTLLAYVPALQSFVDSGDLGYSVPVANDSDVDVTNNTGNNPVTPDTTIPTTETPVVNTSDVPGSVAGEVAGDDPPTDNSTSDTPQGPAVQDPTQQTPGGAGTVMTDTPVPNTPPVTNASSAIGVLERLEQEVSTEMRGFIRNIINYVEAMAPRKILPLNQALQWQVTLYKSLAGIANRADDDFLKIWRAVLGVFHEHKDGVFGESYVFRHFDNMALDKNNCAGFRNILNLIKLTADPKGRKLGLKQIDPQRALQHGLSDHGREALSKFYDL